MLKKLVIAFACLLPSLAFAQQWPNIPQLDSASYCSSTGNGGVCNNTVPAGPAKSGLETVPMDTNAASGQSPQTVKASLASLNALPYSYQLVTSGSAFYTYTVPNNVGKVIFDIASGPISDERVTAPAAPIDGQEVTIASTVTITAFQFIANTGQTLSVTTPTVLTASTTVPQGYRFLYRAADKKWYRLQ